MQKDIAPTTDNIFHLMPIIPGLLAASRVACRCAVALLLATIALLVTALALLAALAVLVAVSALGLVTAALYCLFLAATFSLL